MSNVRCSQSYQSYPIEGEKEIINHAVRESQETGDFTTQSEPAIAVRKQTITKNTA
jgi:hypothetical protein